MNEIVTVADELANASRNIAKYDATIAETMAREIRLRKDWEVKEQELRAKLVEMFEDETVNTEGLTKVENDFIVATYIKATTRDGVDVKELRKALPKVYDKFRKVTPVRSNVRIKVKD